MAVINELWVFDDGGGGSDRDGRDGWIKMLMW